MKLPSWRREPPSPPTVYVGDHTDKLSRMRPIRHDEDECQSAEDRQYGTHLFNRAPVPLPRFLRGGRRNRS
jgi:hypothetical protein